MGSVLALLPREERPAVRAKAQRLYRQVTRRPGDRRRLRRRVCVQVAAIAPQLPVDRLSLLAWHTLWSYRLDDRLEDPDADGAALARLRDGVAGVAAGDPDGPDDPLLAELAQTIDALSRHDRAGELVARFGEVLRDAVAADVDQVLFARAVASGASPPPTAERYLEVASRTVNYRSFAYVLLAVGAGALTNLQLACIDAALWQAAYAVRLGNDLRGAARDRAGPGLNVLRLRTAAGSPVTPGYVAEEIDRRVRAHETALAALTGLGVIPPTPARVLRRSLRQVVSLYRHTDLR